MARLKAIAMGLLLAAGLFVAGKALAQDLRIKGAVPPLQQQEEEKSPGVEQAPGSSTQGTSIKPSAPMKPGTSASQGMGQTQGDLRAGPEASKVGVVQPPKKKRPNIHFSCDEMMCIERVRVKPHGTWAEFEVITTQPARVIVETSLDPPKGNEFSKVERAIFTVKEMISSKTQITGLAPNEDYYYVVQAKDDKGIVQWHHGRFSMAGRNARLEIQRVYATNDGDAGNPDKGEFRFTLESMGEKLHFEVDVETGETVSTSQSLVLAGVPPNVPIKAWVQESDGIIVNASRVFEKTFNVETTGPGENDAVPFEWRFSDSDWDVTLQGQFHISFEN